MAAIQRALSEVPVSVPEAKPVPQGPQAEIARLAALHEEARETAELANLLGRAPMLAAAIIASAALTAVLGQALAAPAAMISWLVLVLIGAGSLLRAYRQAIRAPFERAPLRAFGEDAKAILLYAGFAWGAGAFLALPPAAGDAAIVLFAAGAAVLVALAIRSAAHALVFVVPAAALSAFAAVLRPLDGGPLASALVVVACAAVAGAALWMERRQAGRLPRLGGLALR